jgi:hypothetical protein
MGWAPPSPVLGVAGKIINHVTSRLDVTHERLLESRLRQAQKMEAVGRLAGGVVHDVNRLLIGITGCTESCRDVIAQRGVLDEGVPFLGTIHARRPGAQDAGGAGNVGGAVEALSENVEVLQSEGWPREAGEP